MITFQSRLKSCLANGNLTVADLSRWFGRPHPTVRGWIENGFDPRGGPQDVARIYKLLDILEGFIKRRYRLPIPQLKRQQRIELVEELRRDINRRVS